MFNRWKEYVDMQRPFASSSPEAAQYINLLDDNIGTILGELNNRANELQMPSNGQTQSNQPPSLDASQLTPDHFDYEQGGYIYPGGGWIVYPGGTGWIQIGNMSHGYKGRDFGRQNRQNAAHKPITPSHGPMHSRAPIRRAPAGHMGRR